MGLSLSKSKWTVMKIYYTSLALSTYLTDLHYRAIVFYTFVPKRKGASVLQSIGLISLGLFLVTWIAGNVLILRSWPHARPWIRSEEGDFVGRHMIAFITLPSRCYLWFCLYLRGYS